jgi:seryl-tRNA synthetase
VFDFTPRDHVALCEMNDWADLARITKVSGARTYCLKGRLALLESALMLWAQHRLVAEGFTLMTVPAIAREDAFTATGHFPGGKEDAYAVPKDDPVPRRHRGDRADLAARRRDPDGRPVADPLRRGVPLLPPRGGERRAATCAGSCASISS